MTENVLRRFAAFIGFEPSQVSNKEKLVAAAGSFTGIFCVFLVSEHFVGLTGAAMVVASIGSSTALIFAVPNGTMSQPWPVIGGHLLSAVVGVSAQILFNDVLLAAAVAVGVATGAMYYLRCLHPPAGATALTAVIGGSGVTALGYGFVITPVLLNMLVITLVAIAFNYPFRWRRYPTVLVAREPEVTTTGSAPARQQPEPGPGEVSGISPENLVYALSQIDSFIDVTENDLLRIFDLATAHSAIDEVEESQIDVGCFYSNGDYGENWAIREVVSEIPAPAATDDVFAYNIVAGPNTGESGVCNRAELAQWAKFQVQRVGSSWLPVQGCGEQHEQD